MVNLDQTVHGFDPACLDLCVLTYDLSLCIDKGVQTSGDDLFLSFSHRHIVSDMSRDRVPEAASRPYSRS